MSYQVLARKYRPQRFAEVVGQEHVTQTLTNAIEQGRIAHAYLFCGPRGTGKTTIARIFAKCLNCTGGPKVAFDEHDLRCVEIAEGRSLDVLEIDGASNNGVEQVRELRETVKYAPASARFKIYIIDEVHMLTTAAFNALLKTLEEPPSHVKFMFATTDPEKVLPTILSRCQRFDLRRIPAALIVQHLKRIAVDEGVKVDGAALDAIARGADGAMRDAESTLDQLISFCGNEIVESDVLTMFGLAARGALLSLAEALIGGDLEGALRQLDELARNGKDLGRLLADLLNHFRNLLIYQVSRGDLRLLELGETEAVTLKQQAGRLSAAALGRMLEVLTDAEGRLRDAVSKKILLEVALLKAIQARTAIDLDTVLERLHALRPQDDREALGPPVSAPTGQAAGASRVAEAAPAGAKTKAAALPPAAEAAVPSLNEAVAATRAEANASLDLGTLWSGLVEAVGRASPFTRSYLVRGLPVSFTGKTLVIGFDAEFAEYIPLIDVPRNHALIQTKLMELGFEATQVKFIRVESPSAPRPPAPALAAGAPPAGSGAPATVNPPPAAKPVRSKATKLDPADFKNDPLIKQALEVFKGTIVEVRG